MSEHPKQRNSPASDIDPTGYKAALATIPEGQLSEREMRIAAAMAMVNLHNTPVATAARQAGVPRSTLRNYLNGVTKIGEGIARHRQYEELQDAQVSVALLATEMVEERLSANPEGWENKDLIKASGVATDKVIAMQRKTEDDTPSAASALVQAIAKLGETHDIKLTKRDPSEEAIDVEGKTE